MPLRLSKFTPSLLRRVLNLWLAAFLALGPTTLQAATYYVNASGGSDGAAGTSEGTAFETITHALGEAEDGDTIIVLPGLYDDGNGEEFPLSLVSGVALESRDGAAVTTISAPNGEYVFENDGELAEGTTLEGFTLRHDDGEGTVNDIIMWFGGFEETTLAAASSGIGAPKLNADEFDVEILNNVFVGTPDPDPGETPTGGEVGIFVDVAENAFTGLIENNTFTGFGSQEQLYEYGPGLYSAAILMTAVPEGPPGLSASAAPGNVAPAVEPGPVLAPLIQNNTFSNNSFGVVFAVYSEGFYRFAPEVSRNTFHSNGGDIVSAAAVAAFEYNLIIGFNTSTNPFVGIAVVEAPYGEEVSSTQIERNRVTDPLVLGIGLASAPGDDHEAMLLFNTVTGAGSEGEIYTPFGSVGIGVLAAAEFYLPVGGDGSLNLVIEGNTAGHNEGVGLMALLDGETEMVDEVTVSNNVFTENALAGALLFFSEETAPPPATLAAAGVAPDASNAYVSVINNLISDNGDGLVIDTGDLEGVAFFRCNVIVDNEGDGVTVLDSPGDPPDFGDDGDLGNNSIYGNGGGTGTYDFRNDDNDPVEAIGNYWGTTNLATIDTHIFDNDEDGSSGAVDFSSPLSASTEESCLAAVIADLDITKTASPTTVPPGGTIEYTLVVINNGPATATNVIVTDTLPAEVTFVDASAGCTHAAGTVTCQVGTLLEGQDEEITITATVNQGVTGEFTNTAYAAADQADADAASAGAFTAASAAAVLPAEVPTASEWGLIAMGVLLSISALWVMRRNGLMVLLMLALLGGAFASPALHASERPELQKGTLQSVTIDGEKVVLHFSDRDPITTTRDALRISRVGPWGIPWLGGMKKNEPGAGDVRATSAGQPRRVPAMTPEELSATLGSIGAKSATGKSAGKPVVFRAGTRVELTLVVSEAQANRMVSFQPRGNRRSGGETRPKAD